MRPKKVSVRERSTARERAPPWMMRKATAAAANSATPVWRRLAAKARARSEAVGDGKIANSTAPVTRHAMIAQPSRHAVSLVASRCDHQQASQDPQARPSQWKKVK